MILQIIIIKYYTKEGQFVVKFLFDLHSGALGKPNYAPDS